MKMFATIVLAALVMPFVAADPTVQTGTQNGCCWIPAAEVAVQGGSNFLLGGVVGDHDIFFYDAAGNFVGFSIACGADVGVVPDEAVTGLIVQWDGIGQIAPCVITVGAPSTWVYVDGF